MENKIKAKVGQWTPYRKLMPDDRFIFDQCVQHLIGISYYPLSVSTQVVNGMNYRFKCSATPSYPGALDYKAIIQIYSPIEGEPHITDITPI